LVALFATYCLKDVSCLYDPTNKYADELKYFPTDCSGPDILYLYSQVHNMFITKLVITDVDDFYNLCFGLHMIIDLFHMCKNRFEGKNALNPWVLGDCEAGQVGDKVLDNIRVAKAMPKDKTEWPTWVLWPAAKNQSVWPPISRPWPIGQNWPEFPEWSEVVAWPVLDFGKWPLKQCHPYTQDLDTSDKGKPCDPSTSNRRLRRSANNTEEKKKLKLSPRYSNPLNLTYSEKYSWISGSNSSLAIPFNDTELKNFITDLTNPNLSRKGRRRVKRSLNVQQHLLFTQNLAETICERDFFIKKEFPAGSKLVIQFYHHLLECYNDEYLFTIKGARKDGNIKRIFYHGCCGFVDLILCLRKKLMISKCNRRCRRYIEFMMNAYVVPFVKREFCSIYPKHYDFTNIGEQKKLCSEFKTQAEKEHLNLALDLKAHAGLKPLPNVEIIIFMVILVLFIAFRMKRC